MAVEDLGEPLTAVYSVPGGQARLHERGLTVNGAGGGAIVSFAFPMIGRPSIVTGAAVPMVRFGPAHFLLAWAVGTSDSSQP